MRLRIGWGWPLLFVVLWLTAILSAQSSQQFKRVWFAVDARTIASNGGGTPATLTLTPTSSYVTITCNDTDGCNITMGETGVPDGLELVVVNVSANTVNFANSAGVQQLGTSIALAQWDALTLKYVTDRWVGVSVSP